MWLERAAAQEGWPYSAWDDKKERQLPSGNTDGTPLQPLDAPPRFGRPGATGGSGSYASPQTPSFGAPPAVDKVDLEPLAPVEPAPGERFDNRQDGSPPSPSGPGRWPEAEPTPTYGNDFRRPPSDQVNRAPQPGRSFDQGPKQSAWTAPSVASARDDIDPAAAIPLLKNVPAAASPILRRLASRAVQAEARSGAGNPAAYEAARIDAMSRLGLLKEAAEFRIPANVPAASSDWAGFALRISMARAGLADSDGACRDARDIVAAADGLPATGKNDAILLSGYCGAHQGSAAAVNLAADVAADSEGFSPAALAALQASAKGSKPRVPPGTAISPLTYRLLRKSGAEPSDLAAARPDPGFLMAMAADRELPPDTRVAAAEKAASIGAIAIEDLKIVYRRAGTGTDIESVRGGSDNATGDPASRRAALFIAAERQPTPLQKVRLIRGYLDSARKSGVYWAALKAMEDPVIRLAPVPEIGWFAETAIEVLAASGRSPEARNWLRLGESSDPRGSEALAHWAALIDVADIRPSPDRGRGLAALERLALRGAFEAKELHRVATVLDALAFQVPIPLWDAASRTPQPSDGHLPPTGILSRLQEASKSGETAETILLVLNAIGPDGPRGAHLIALGDCIRALRRAGLQEEAGQLALEALFPVWPRALQG